jgi:hypothetical protein
VLDLLRHPDRHWELLQLVEELLPLVAAPLVHLWDPEPAEAQASSSPGVPQGFGEPALPAAAGRALV